MAKEIALTTIDNPFDPIDQFDDWFAWDEENGYGTCAYLARLCPINDSLPDETNSLLREEIIDNIVANNPLKIYKKVVHE